ncbi:MAG TPA: aldehyde dehydrogenase family protein, partial [Hyphomicrobiales bacterium]|nr:aldehyde dehydrogenase family protein [Hyphomicrobiales bacterium]
MSIKTINPATADLIGEYPEMPLQEANAAVDAAHVAYLDWRRKSIEERAKPMKRVAELLRERSRELAKLMASEMGKPITQGMAEANKCALVCDYYADNAKDFLKPEAVPMDSGKGMIVFQPIGVIMAIMPWNFPFWQVFRFIAPAFMAGNAGVLKHASNVPGCALAIETLMKDAGFPENLFRTLLIGSKAANEVLEHPNIRAATLTGSELAGRAVARKAGELLKKTVLELGGSDAYLILDDAD